MLNPNHELLQLETEISDIHVTNPQACNVCIMSGQCKLGTWKKQCSKFATTSTNHSRKHESIKIHKAGCFFLFFLANISYFILWALVDHFHIPEGLVRVRNKGKYHSYTTVLQSRLKNIFYTILYFARISSDEEGLISVINRIASIRNKKGHIVKMQLEHKFGRIQNFSSTFQQP